MKKILSFLLGLLLLACAGCALAQDGLWVDDNQLLECRVEGASARLRAHLPIGIPVTFTLNEETGWFECTGVITQDTLTAGNTAVSFSLQPDGRLKLGDMLMNPASQGLTFDPAQVYGSWHQQDALPYSKQVSYIDLDSRLHKINAFFPMYNTHLYVDGERAVMMEETHSKAQAPFGQKQYALDASLVEVRESGVFVTFDEIRVKLLPDGSGGLLAFPLLTFEEQLELFAIGQDPNQLCLAPFTPLVANIYSAAPEVEPGVYQLSHVELRYEGSQKHEAKIAQLMSTVGNITFGENNSLTLELDGEVFSGELAFPDPYSCANKETFPFFSVNRGGYTLSLTLSQDGDRFLLSTQQKGKRLITFALASRAEEAGRLVGAYRMGDTSLQPGFDSWAEHNGALVVTEDLTFTGTLWGNTHTAALEPYGILDPRRARGPGSVTWGDRTYDVSMVEIGPVRILCLQRDAFSAFYYPVDPALVPFLLDPSTLRFRCGQSASTQGAQPDSVEVDRLFQSLTEGIFFISPALDRAVFQQPAVSSLFPGDTRDFLFLQEQVECDIPILSAETNNGEITLRLDLHGHEATFLSRPGGECELVMGPYHVAFDKLN